MIFFVIAGLVIALGAILFAFQNSTLVSISFGVWQFEQSLAIVLLITLGLGIIISLLLSIPTIIKRGLQTSSQKKKIRNLEAELQSKIEANSLESEKVLTIKQYDRELLQALAASDSATGLLNKDTAVTISTHLLTQMKNQSSNPRYSSLCALLLSIEPGKSSRNSTEEFNSNSVYKAIANRLVDAASPDHFLAITDKKRFICLVPGLAGQQATDYGRYLQDKLVESPLQKADGSTMPLKVRVGGVIVDPSDTVDSRNILKQAEQNLEMTSDRGNNSLLISEITTKTL
ncbi:MAG: LapA family protein [Cyanobacteria bacterium P01_G01_bin.39]